MEFGVAFVAIIGPVTIIAVICVVSWWLGRRYDDGPATAKIPRDAGLNRLDHALPAPQDFLVERLNNGKCMSDTSEYTDLQEIVCEEELLDQWAPSTGSTRFGVYGSCQAHDFAASLKMLVPGCSAAAMIARPGMVPPEAKDYDVLFVQPPVAKRLSEETLRQAKLFPVVTFTGFHPDCIYLLQQKRIVRSAASQYHSSLIIACFLLDLPLETVGQWIDEAHFTRFGFFEEFARARAFLIDHAQSIGIDISSTIDDWSRRDEAFMHTINHPRAYVLRDICRLVLTNAGISYRDVPPPRDRMRRGARWPVYAPIANHLGLTEQPMFYGAAVQNGMSRHEFATGCYEIYKTLPREILSASPQVSRILPIVRDNLI